MTKEDLKNEIIALIEDETVCEDDIMKIKQKIKNDNKEPA